MVKCDGVSKIIAGVASLAQCAAGGEAKNSDGTTGAGAWIRKSKHTLYIEPSNFVKYPIYTYAVFHSAYIATAACRASILRRQL